MTLARSRKCKHSHCICNLDDSLLALFMQFYHNTLTTTSFVMKSSVQAAIEEKREELLQLKVLNKYTYDLVLQLEEIQEKLLTMGDGVESVALILSNWQNVINSISLASMGVMKYSSKDYKETQPLPETLVRIKLDKDSEETEN